MLRSAAISGGWGLDLIGMLAHRRFERERSRRAAALREAWEKGESEQLVAQEPEPRSVTTSEPEPTLSPAQTARRPQSGWECDFCGRSFHGYGSYLNHRCHSQNGID